MRLKDFDQEYNLTGMISRPLYFGLFTNVMVPVGLLFVCYWIDQNYHPINRIPEQANFVFYLFAALGLVQAALALWWREKKFRQPMVRREETFEADLTHRVFQFSRPIFLLIGAISIWGYLYYYLTARFDGAVIFVVGSFLVFQLVRPRYGSLNRLIAYQKKLVKEGKFYQGPSLLE